MTKDYYKILGISTEAREDEIKKAYRRLALQYHPDRNPGDIGAEERFKEIAEAYTILVNSGKRRDYDSYRQTRRSYSYSGGFSSGGNSGGGGSAGAYGRQSQAGPNFSYSSEEVFQEMFRNPRTSDFFSELQREFERQGFRFNETFFRDLFSRRQGVFFGGIYYINGSTDGSTGRFYRFGTSPFEAARSAPAGRRAEDARPWPPQQPGKGLFSQLLQLFFPQFFRQSGDSLGSTLKRLLGVNGTRGRDLTYRIRISRREATLGKEIQFTYRRGSETERLSLRVPAGVRNGSRLKLSGMGLPGEEGRQPGDLYIQVKIV